MRSMTRLLTGAMALVSVLAHSPAASTAQEWWTERPAFVARPVAGTEALPAAYRSFEIDATGFRRAVASAPQSYQGMQGALEFGLPTPDGGEMRFRVVESPILSAAMQAHRPDIRTYVGVGLDDPRARVRFGIAGDEFHARVRRSGGVSYTVAGMPGMPSEMVLAWYDVDRPARSFTCLTDTDLIDTVPAEDHDVLARRLGNQLRTYDFAVTSTGELTQFAGGVTQAENLITAVVNFTNAVYETELAVTFQIVDFNVYTDPATDPFPNGEVLDGNLINQNNSALNLKLGSSGYDVGHVLGFTPGSGTYGLAYVASQCRSNLQGGAGTFSGGPSSAALADVVLHEVGHSLGATHSFNSTTGGCEGNRSGVSAYEIGSGLTIMSYAGLCGTENIQNEDIDYFNSGALAQITTRINQSTSCGSAVTTGNSIPSVDAGPSVTIPLGTAFVLEGSATDADEDPLTFSWEQHDLGAASPPIDPASGPAFRNFEPVDSPVRSVPEYSLYRRNFTPQWEKLPTVPRSFNFRLIVRDNNPLSGATAWATRTVTATGDPFVITAPNGGESYPAGSTVSLQWTVGGGSVASEVRVLQSVDEGVTWSEILASTANDGQVDVPAPCEVTTKARYRLEAIGNIFFDISNANFSVTAETVAPVINCPGAVTLTTTSDDGLPKTDTQYTDLLASIEATDNCDTDLALTEFAPDVLPLGTTNVPVLFTDDFGNFSVCVLFVTVEKVTSSPAGLRTALLGAVPNPFNPRTTVSFDLARTQTVELEVIDVRGRRVVTLTAGSFAAGRHEVVWNGLDAEGTQAPSGVYFLRLTTEDGVFTGRAALLK